MITVERTGRVRFRAYFSHAERVEILGDFTGWDQRPIPMRHVGDGWWEAETQPPAGDSEFRYRADGWRWVTDFAAHGVTINRFGSLNSCLRIPATQRPRLAA